MFGFSKHMVSQRRFAKKWFGSIQKGILDPVHSNADRNFDLNSSTEDVEDAVHHVGAYAQGAPSRWALIADYGDHQQSKTSTAY